MADYLELVRARIRKRYFDVRVNIGTDKHPLISVYSSNCEKRTASELEDILLEDWEYISQFVPR